jgi:hypothetical protein
MPTTGPLVSVLDDEPEMRKALRRLLTCRGFRGEEYARAEDLFALLGSHPLDHLGRPTPGLHSSPFLDGMTPGTNAGTGPPSMARRTPLSAAQVGAGFVTKGPLDQLGLAHSRTDDGMGLGFLWSQPAASSAAGAPENKFGLDAIYVLQLTPMANLQSDFQAIWDPAYNPGASHAFVFQIQLAPAW